MKNNVSECDFTENVQNGFHWQWNALGHALKRSCVHASTFIIQRKAEKNPPLTKCFDLSFLKRINNNVIVCNSTSNPENGFYSYQNPLGHGFTKWGIPPSILQLQYRLCTFRFCSCAMISRTRFRSSSPP